MEDSLAVLCEVTLQDSQTPKMAPKMFYTRKVHTKGKRPPGVPAQMQPAVEDATSEVEDSPAVLQEFETSFEGQYVMGF